MPGKAKRVGVRASAGFVLTLGCSIASSQVLFLSDAVPFDRGSLARSGFIQVGHDNIVIDLVTPFRFNVGGKIVERRIVGGLLGHWAVWTKKAVELHAECRRVANTGEAIPVELLRRAVEVTDANAAFFDAAHNYAGCIPGLHEVLRRQGLLEGLWCLDPNESLSPGQREEIDRVYRAYPHLNDDEFVAQHRDEWLGG